MKMPFLIYGLCISIMAITTGCARKEASNPLNTSVPQTSMAGAFSLIQLDGLQKALVLQSSEATGDTLVFNLGTIRASRDFYFILANTGNTDIDSVVLTSTNPAFTVTPTAILKLKPSGASTIGTIIRVTAIHGVSLDGVGYTKIMSPGRNGSCLTYSGYSHNQDLARLAVNGSAQLNLDAQVMDVAIIDSLRAVDFSKPDAHMSCNAAGIGWARVYTVFGQTRIINKGNVTVDIYYFSHTVGTLPDTSLQPGDTAEIPIRVFNNLPLLRIDGHNTVADYSRLQLGTDGAAYLSVSHSTFPSIQ